MRLFCEKCKKDFAVNREEAGKEVACPKCENIIAVPESGVAPGVVLGDFLIEDTIASGGMGVVYLARQISLDRQVALKVLQNKHTDDKEYVESLYREARAAAKISHPNVVQAYAIGEEDGIFYFAMELVRGDTFKTILKANGGKLEFEQAARVVRDVARALSAAWKEQKLVHQDIKPDNIMLDSNGFAKLADLGLAKSAAAHQDENEDADEVLGTPQYISPEQLTGVPTDIRSDIYSLGATFYQFVTGRYAYVAESVDKLAQMHVDGNLEPPKNVNPQLPDELNSIIVKMMARQPEDRYQDAEGLIADLEKYLLKAKSASVNGASADKTVKKVVPPLTLRMNVPRSSAPGTIKAAPGTVKAAPPAAAPGTIKAAPPAAAPGTVKAAPPAAAPGTIKAAPPAAAPGTVKAASPVAQAAPAEAAKVAAITPESVKNANPETEKKEAVKAESGKKVASEKKRTSIGKYFKWGFIGLGGLLILAIAFFITVFILGRKGKLPEFLKPVSNYMDQGVAKAKDKAIELAKPKEIVHEEVVTRPVSRPEYLAKIDELLKFRRAHREKRDEFLAQVDAVYTQLAAPVTDEEKKAFELFLQGFSPTDEQFRCVPARTRLRQELVDKLSARVAAREEKEAEEKRQLELKKRQEEAAAKRAQEIEKRNKQEKIEQKKRIQELKVQCDQWSEKLAVAMVDTVISGDRTALDELKRDIDSAVKIMILRYTEERNMIAQLKKFMTALEKEMKNLTAYKKELEKVNAKDRIYITLGRQAMTVSKIEPGFIRCIMESGSERTTVLHGLTEKVRSRLCRRLKSKYGKLNNADFFISLFDRHVDKIALKDKPEKGFWKDYWNNFAKGFEKK